MERTLFIAWQDKVKRGWYPVGMLNADIEKPIYRFRYIRGAERARRVAGFEPLVSFPAFDGSYESMELFPFFTNRLLQPNREEYKDWLKTLSLENPDPIEILALTEGGRQTDNLEVFPKIERGPDGGFQCNFFLHGLRHLNAHSQERVNRLEAGTPLIMAVELNNPVTKIAVQLQTDEDYHIVGWAPRYLLHDLINVMGEDAFNVRASVARVNPETTPLKNRVLIHVEGHCPAGYEPMTSDDYEPISC